MCNMTQKAWDNHYPSFCVLNGFKCWKDGLSAAGSPFELQPYEKPPQLCDMRPSSGSVHLMRSRWLSFCEACAQ